MHRHVFDHALALAGATGGRTPAAHTLLRPAPPQRGRRARNEGSPAQHQEGQGATPMPLDLWLWVSPASSSVGEEAWLGCGRAHESASGPMLWVHPRPVAGNCKWPKSPPAGQSVGFHLPPEAILSTATGGTRALLQLSSGLPSQVQQGSGRVKVGTLPTTTAWHPRGRRRVCACVVLFGGFWPSPGWTRGVCVGCGLPPPRPPVSCACQSLHERRWRPMAGVQGWQQQARAHVRCSSNVSPH